jgi:hypothetical protein
MLHWFYAVIVEDNGWFSTAVRASCEQNARSALARRYPHGRVHSICE